MGPKPRDFWSCVRATPSGCWEWQRSRVAAGYGRVRHRGSVAYAHRVAWELANGRPIPDGLHVCHSCDNPPCVNPAHLWLGTNADNQRDKAAKGRCWNQVDTDLCLRVVRDPRPPRALAAVHGVSVRTIYRWREYYAALAAVANRGEAA